jgi:hypothetical protein
MGRALTCSNRPALPRVAALRQRDLKLKFRMFARNGFPRFVLPSLGDRGSLHMLWGCLGSGYGHGDEIASRELE